MIKLLVKSLLGVSLFFAFVIAPSRVKADCALNQGDPAARPIRCTVNARVYWCSTNEQCRTTQNMAINNPPPAGIGAFSAMFNDLNQHLVQNGAISSPSNFIGNTINTLMPLIFVIAGMGLLVMLMSGGFQVMTAVQDPNRAEEGKQRIVAALIGFFILFASYWIVQALEIIFGIKILS